MTRRSWRRNCIPVAAVLTLVCGCSSHGSPDASPSTLTGHGPATQPSHLGVATAPRLLSELRQCDLIPLTQVATAYSHARTSGDVPKNFGAIQTPVTVSFQPHRAATTAIDTCAYTATVSGQGRTVLYTIGWTTNRRLVGYFLSHTRRQSGDTNYERIKPPPGFSIAYRNDGGLFLARHGLAITLGGPVGPSLNDGPDSEAAVAITRCLQRGAC